MSKTNFSVQQAEFGSLCRGCRKLIEAPDVEVRAECELADEDKTAAAKLQQELGPVSLLALSKFHPAAQCLAGFRRSSDWWLTKGPKSVDDVRDSELLGEEQRESLRSILETLKSDCEQFQHSSHDDEGESSPSSGLASGKTTKRQRTKKEPAGEESGDERVDVKKRRKTTSSNGPTTDYAALNIPQDKIDAIKEVYAAWSKKTLPVLKAMLKANSQKTSGVKDEVLTRCAEGKILGALPRCPTCDKATVRWLPEGTYECPGWFDSHPHKCSYKADEVERIPWVDDAE